MSRTKQNLTRLLLTSVTALGLFSTAIILSDPPPVDLDAPSAIFQANSQALVGRDLASLDETLVDLNCANEVQSKETNNLRFRLKGSNCTAENSGPTIATQVKNISNGYVATVFHRSPQEFTTDYINLNEGKNEIEVKFETDQGIIERHLMVVRMPTSVAN